MALCAISHNLLGIGFVNFYDVENINRNTLDDIHLWSTNNEFDGHADGKGELLLVRELPSTMGREENNPARAYLPINDSSSAQHVFAENPELLVPEVMTSTQASGHIIVRLFVENNSQHNAHLMAAAEDTNGQYIIIAKNENPIEPEVNSRQRYEFPLALQNICLSERMDSCALFRNNQFGDKQNVKIYFFLAPQGAEFPNYEIQNEISASALNSGNNSGGVYLNLFLSDKVIDDGPRSSLHFINLIRGDSSLQIVYRLSRQIEDTYRLMSLLRQRPFPLQDTPDSEDTDTPDPDPDPDTEDEASSTPKASSYMGEGTSIVEHIQAVTLQNNILIPNLENETRYYIMPFVLNKYQFASAPPLPIVLTPMALEEVLQKEQCYILSAGFQEKHFVVDYFRFLRDHLLLRFSLGRSLVHFYYETAPEYTLSIKSKPLLNFFTRLAAYILFFTINISLIAFIMFMIFRWRR